MKSGNLLHSAVQFIFALLVIMVGVLFLGLKYAPHLRISLAHFFLHSTVSLATIGYLIIGCGIFLLIGFYCLHRGAYYRFSMGAKKTSIDPAIVEQYVGSYWKTVFPNQDLGVQVRFSKNQKIEMFLEFPQMAEERQFELLEQAEPALAKILDQQLCYKKEFLLSVLIRS